MGRRLVVGQTLLSGARQECLAHLATFLLKKLEALSHFLHYYLQTRPKGNPGKCPPAH